MMTPKDIVSEETYAVAFLESYDEEEIVFFDTETTGLNVVEEDIVQIAAFKVRGGKKVEGSNFCILMETERQLPERLGDIENPLIKAYAENEHLTRKEGLSKFLDYIGDDAVLGHNVDYDYHILKYNVERTLKGRSVDNVRRWDSLRLVRLVEPKMMSYKLKDLLKALKIEGENTHLADDDVAATKSVVDYCVGKIRGIVERQGQFLSSDQATTIKSRLDIIKPLMDKIMSRLYCRAESETSIADVMRKINKWIVDNKTIIQEKKITDIQEKISLKIRRKGMGRRQRDSYTDRHSARPPEIPQHIPRVRPRQLGGGDEQLGVHNDRPQSQRTGIRQCYLDRCLRRCLSFLQESKKRRKEGGRKDTICRLE